MECCCCTYIILAAIAAAFLYFRSCCKSCKKAPEILEKNYKKDKVYLYQFPRLSFIPNLSPFCLKLESFMRLHKIDYEVREIKMGRSKYGLLPFIELNGEHIADSQIIIERLKKQFSTKNGLSDKDEAVSRAFERMVEQHTFYLGVHYKVADGKFGEILMKVFNLNATLESIIIYLFTPMFQRKANKRVKISLGSFSDEEFSMLLDRDFTALSKFKGEHKFLFGDTITDVDATIFAHLASIYYLPMDSYYKSQLDTQYKSLSVYLNNVRDALYPNDFTAN